MTSITTNIVEVGIDPGLSGGIALRDNNGIVHALSMPPTEGDLAFTLQKVARLAESAGAKVVAYVENIPLFTGKNLPGSSVAKLFRNFGFILGCLQTLGVEIKLLRPQQWQKLMSMGTKGSLTTTAWKNKLKAEAQRLFPQLGTSVTLKTADALLILEAGGKS